jgi:hypothetical protein
MITNGNIKIVDDKGNVLFSRVYIGCEDFTGVAQWIVDDLEEEIGSLMLWGKK